MRDILHNIFTFSLIVLCICLLFTFSCIPKKTVKSSEPDPLSLSYHDLWNSNFKNEIIQKEKMLQSNNITSNIRLSSAEYSKLLIQLSILYSHKNNPDSDYGTALKYLKQYALTQDQVSIDYVENLLTNMVENKIDYEVLNNKYMALLEDQKKLEKSYSILASKIQAKDRLLKKNRIAIKNSKEEIKQKNDIIEKLKVLDIKLENQRIKTE